MSLYLPGLLQTLLAAVFLFVAFRAHERFWALGFMGWRKVYAGLVLYLLGGLLNLWFQWSGTGTGASVLFTGALGHLTTALSAVGIGLLLAGSIERLRDLAVERRRLETVRAGFDLFDTLREVAGGPYAYLEVLEFSLKEMVRAADVACGGLWLFNPKTEEWVLTGAANMAQAFRQQVESVRGSGTGFDRLSRAHTAHLFVRPEEIRLFWPEWEAEGYQAILGLPLLTASAGQKERRLLGVIILADPDSHCFDDDRVRRLHAAADYVAAVIAEARLHRELEAAYRRASQELAAAGERTAEVRTQLERTNARHEEERQEWETKHRALESEHAEQVNTVRVEAGNERERLVAEYEAKLGAQAERFDEFSRNAAETRRAMERQHAERVATLEAETSGERDRLVAEYDAQLKDQADRLHHLRQESEETRRRMEAGSAARVAAIQAEAKAERERLTAAYDEKLKAQTDRVGELSRTFEETRRALESEHNQHLSAVRAESKSERERLISEYNGELRTREVLLAELGREIEEMRRTLASQATAFEGERHEWSQRVCDWENTLAAARTELHESETAFKEQLQRVASETEKLRTELSDQHRIYEERVKALMARLDDERRAAAAVSENYRERLQSLKDEIAARTDEWLSERDDERRQAAEREREQESLLATAQAAHQEAADAWDETKRDLFAQAAGLEEELRRVHAQHAIALEGIREEWNLERTQSRERLRVLTDRLHAAQKSVRDAAACLRDPDPRDMAVARLLPRLPAGTQVFVWQRLADGLPRLLLTRDRDGALAGVDPAAVRPWAFEIDTIPAEGPRSMPDDLHWSAMESAHRADQGAAWDEIWGIGRRPHWAVCWPWGAGGGPGENGWVTAFGFSESIPSPERIDGLAMSAEIIGACACPGRRLVDTITPPAPAPAEVPPAEAAIPPVPVPTMGLHDALIAWVADQDKDGWRLELSASTVPSVAADWLAGVLDRGQASCRTNGGDQNNEFLIATETTNGRTTLRLVNTRALDSGDLAVPEHRDDRALDGDTPGVGDMPTAAGRWLVSGDRYLGLEVTFERARLAPGETETSWESEAANEDGDRLRILIADGETAMCELLVGMVETLGHDAVGARDSQEASHSFEEQQFDVVIVNADMPQRSGISLAEWVKSGAPHVPVILITEQGFDDPSFQGIADCVLRQPFRLDQLQECLESVAPPRSTVADIPAHEENV